MGAYVAQPLVSLVKPGCFNSVQFSPTPSLLFEVQRGTEAWCGGDQRRAVFERGMSSGVLRTHGQLRQQPNSKWATLCATPVDRRGLGPNGVVARQNQSCSIFLKIRDCRRSTRLAAQSRDIPSTCSLSHDSALGMGGERISGGGAKAVEFDGPSHFLASWAPKGATLLKRQHLQLLGHALVSVPYWKWGRCKGAGEGE